MLDRSGLGVSHVRLVMLFELCILHSQCRARATAVHSLIGSCCSALLCSSQPNASVRALVRHRTLHSVPHGTIPSAAPRAPEPTRAKGVSTRKCVLDGFPRLLVEVDRVDLVTRQCAVLRACVPRVLDGCQQFFLLFACFCIGVATRLMKSIRPTSAPTFFLSANLVNHFIFVYLNCSRQNCAATVPPFFVSI